MEEKTIWLLVVVTIAILGLVMVIFIINKVGSSSAYSNIALLQLISSLFS